MKAWLKDPQTKKILKILLIGFGSLLLIVVCALLFIWSNPKMIWNSHVFNTYGRPYLSRQGIEWRGEAHFDADSPSFRKKSFSLKLADNCLVIDKEQDPFCVKRLSLKFNITFAASWKPSLEIEELLLESGPARWKTLPSATTPTPEPVEESESTLTTIASWLNRIDFGRVKIDVPRFEYFEGSRGLYAARLNLSNEGDGLDFKVGGEEMSPPKRPARSFSAQLLFNDRKSSPGFDVKLNGELKAGDIMKAPLLFQNCTVHYSGEWRKFDFEKGDLDCPFKVSSGGLIRKRRIEAEMPKFMDARLKIEAARNRSRIEGQVILEVGPVLNSFAKGGLNAKYKFSVAALSDFNKQSTPIEVDGRVKITDFYRVAKLLNGVGILIPAPANALQGKVGLEFGGSYRLDTEKAELKLTLGTDLKSKDQALELLADGKLNWQSCAKSKEKSGFEIELLAKRMKLRLPDIDVKNPPALVVDSRFTKKKAATAHDCDLGFSFSFENEKNSPVYISSVLLQNSLPVDIWIKSRSDSSTKGAIKIRNYSTTFFKRKSTLESFDYDLDTKIIGGRVRVDYSETKIFLLLSGTSDSIRLDFQSDPPLPREQVFSVLFFGKKLEGLDEDESGSVRNADAAAKDGALSLASLYLLASTPIESIGYNSHTNGLTAKVKLSSGTTLNVGANSQGVTDLGVTKRLSQHWRIQTTVKDPDVSEERSASAVLEFFNRF